MAEARKEVSKAGKGTEIQKATPMRVSSPFEEMDRLFEGFFPRGWLRPFHLERPLWDELAAPLEVKAPRVDVVDRDEDILVRAELPGVEKKDLELSVTDNTVTVSGKTRHEEKEEKGNYYRCEISRGAFSRTVALPSDVDPDKAKAAFKDGLLELTIPKVAKAKRRSIKLD
jgi:HSP20 family protein